MQAKNAYIQSFVKNEHNTCIYIKVNTHMPTFIYNCYTFFHNKRKLNDSSNLYEVIKRTILNIYW